MYTTEREMSINFESFIKKEFGNSYIKECSGLFGIPDFVIYDKTKKTIPVISFELKLTNWKRAAKQAFRYKSFSNISYVVMSNLSTKATLEKINFFKKYNIGLAKFDNNSHFEILYKPESSTPYSEELNRKLIESVKTSRKKAKNLELLFQ